MKRSYRHIQQYEKEMFEKWKKEHAEWEKHKDDYANPHLVKNLLNRKFEFEEGKINIIYLVGIILAVSFLNPSYIPAMGDHHSPLYVRFLREIVLVAIGAMSWFTTKKSIRLDNKYSWEPIIEVAYLFIGIFVTMTPALIYLLQIQKT